MVPSSRSLLSRDKRLPHGTWNQSGLQENVFGNQLSTFDSPNDETQRFQCDNVQRNREAVPEAGRTKTSHTSEDRQNQGTNPMQTFATKTVDYEFYNTGGITSELHGRTAKTANIGIVIRFTTQVTTCSDFPSDAMLWITEVEMVDSVDECKSSRSVYGKGFSKFRDAGREDCFCSEQDHPEFPFCSNRLSSCHKIRCSCMTSRSV